MTAPDTLPTPCAVIDVAQMDRNIARMQQRMTDLGVRFRPHVKTAKCLEVARRQLQAGASGITVSTLKEAEQFFAAGFKDILYAVGIAPNKFAQALALRQRGCALKLVTDNAASALALGRFGAGHGHPFELWIEIDCDGHRSGIPPEAPELLEVARAVVAVRAPSGKRHRSARRRLRLLRPGDGQRRRLPSDRRGAERAHHGDRPPGGKGLGDRRRRLDGDEPRPRPQEQKHDYGYGQVCTADGKASEGYVLSSANQEHGILSRMDGVGGATGSIVERFPVGTQLRILPNHACATGAQFPEYVALQPGSSPATWPRFYGW